MGSREHPQAGCAFTATGCLAEVSLTYLVTKKKCGGSNETGNHRLRCLYSGSLVGRTILGRVRRYALAGGGVSLRVGFEVSKAHTRPSLVLSLPPTCGSDVSS